MSPQKQTPKRLRKSSPQARGELRRKQLIEAASTLLESHRVQDISYADIAERADIPLPSCYHFFQNKLDLLEAVSEDLAPDYRQAVLEKEVDPKEVEWWGDIIDIVSDRSRDFFRSQPAAREIWLSGHVPPAISIHTREREMGLGVMLKELIGQHFKLPEIRRADMVFYITHEIGDRICSLSQLLHGNVVDEMVEESKRAKKSYLLNYLPPVLIRVDGRD